MAQLEKLKNELNSGRISRREFVRATSMLGLAAMAPGMLTTAQAAPKKGGKFTAGLGHGSTTDSLDPATWENDFITGTGYARYNYLTEIDTDGNLIGELAESWEASADARQWTFRLRKGVEFHNGKTLAAEDVVASINHHRGEGSHFGGQDLRGSDHRHQSRRQ